MFDDLGFVRGASYFFAVYLAFSNATFFSIARVEGGRYIPLGAVAPIFILAGVIGSSAIRPLIGDSKDAAMAQDFLGALVILAVFAVMTLWFRLSRVSMSSDYVRLSGQGKCPSRPLSMGGVSPLSGLDPVCDSKRGYTA